LRHIPGQPSMHALQPSGIGDVAIAGVFAVVQGIIVDAELA